MIIDYKGHDSELFFIEYGVKCFKCLWWLNRILTLSGGAQLNLPIMLTLRWTLFIVFTLRLT